MEPSTIVLLVVAAFVVIVVLGFIFVSFFTVETAHASGTPVLTNTYDISGSILAQKMQGGGAFKYHYEQDPSSYRELMVPSLMVDPRGLFTYFQYGPNGYSQSLPMRPPY